MSLANELSNLDATSQAELVRKKEVQPVELIEAAIDRIEKVNPQINSIVTKMYDEARAAAKVDMHAAPFAGVPFLLKDLLAAYKGVRMSSGSRYLKDFKPNQDSELVNRFKRAGLIVVGKTNTPEFGILPTTEPELFGAARNPWNTNRTTGGSSGGSAAAVAAGIVPMAHPGFVLRHIRAQTDPRPQPPRTKFWRYLQWNGCRTCGFAHRARQRCVAGCDIRQYVG
jgi:amidase